MKSSIGTLYPSIYRGVLETDTLTQVEDQQFNEWFRRMEEARNNQFILTAEEEGIAAFERIYEIAPLPGESLEFRRQRVLGRMRLQPPFTMRFLRRRLNEIVGIGMYELWLDNENYTLYIDAAAEDAGWYQEVHVLVGKVKPANIVFIFRPLIAQGAEMGETIINRNFQWAYALGSWRLGEKPFAELKSEEVMKVPEKHSLQEAFFEQHASHTLSQVQRVLLNDTYEINTFQSKTVNGSVAEIEYLVPEDLGVSQITSIKLMTGEGDVLSNARVYIPAGGLLTLRHTIDHKEVATNG